MSTAAPGSRRPRGRLIIVWALIGLAVLAVFGLLATGRLNADLVPTPAAAPAPRVVDCYQADPTPAYSWVAGAAAGAEGDAAPRVDPVAVCIGLIRDAEAVEQLDQLATQQQALGRDCVTFATSDGGSWALTGLQSADKTYTASGGPAPGRLPSFGVVSQPAPLASLTPAPTPTAGCVRLPILTWRLPVPPLAACTADNLTVSVYERQGSRTAHDVCASKGLVVAGD